LVVAGARRLANNRTERRVTHPGEHR
jgi:hypothetical protein